jgi:hypothetical protein
VATEKLLQGEHLPTIAQRVLRDESQFGQRVDDEALRPMLLHRLDHRLGGFSQFHLGRIENGQLGVCGKAPLRRHQFCHVDA